jgi:spore germination protein KC
MKKIRITLMILIIFINSIFTTSCWNYREVDELSIVAGVAIDKGIESEFQMTVEIVQISSARDTKKTSKTITAEGDTMFDAARNLIALSGKRLYWSHAQVIILSKEVASEGIIRVIEWYNRDSETREEASILISEKVPAREIFYAQGTTEDVKSFVLEEIIGNQGSLSKAPIVDVLKFDIESKTKGISTVLPTINLKEMGGKVIPRVAGTAIIKDDKLIGFLNGDETKDLIFIRDEVKGGVLIEEMQTSIVPIFVSLEIFKNKTKVTPIVDNKGIKISLNINTTVAIDEMGGIENFIDDEGRIKLEESAENSLKKRIEALINKVQSEYKADIFGFGAKLRENKIEEWNKVSDNWEEIFKELKVNVKTKVHIKNSAILSKPLEKSD